MSNFTKINFPEYNNVRCLMMPYIQGEPHSVPDAYISYRSILSSLFLKKGDIGFLTIDESLATAGKPHRGQRARYGRALHTEAGILGGIYGWAPTWGGSTKVKLDRDVKVLIASNISDTCAVWNAEQEDISIDGDIGYLADKYPYSDAKFLKAGEVAEIGILTPHESLPVKQNVHRQFIRIVSSGVQGREDYFTINPLM